MSGGAGPGLHSGFLRACEATPDGPALIVEERSYTYAELGAHASRVAATLHAREPEGPPLVAVFAYRTLTAFAGILGALMAGRGYVPLNRNLPAARSRLMLERSGARALVADSESAEQLPEMLDGVEDGLLILVPDVEDPSDLAGRLPGHTVVGGASLAPAESWSEPSVDPDGVAYVLFTSGSTGVPKGVTVLHRNLPTLIDDMLERYGITADDRVSQTHELTFDVSVWDMFVCWEAGACLCCPSQKELLGPGRFIRRHEVTVWFSVPSTAVFMKRLGMLKPDSYPSLRYSLFAGEPLPVQVAEAWLEAAPQSTVENLYGPTELTIVCMGYRWTPGQSESEAEAGVIPIGYPLAANEPLVAGEQLAEVGPGEVGELLVAGPQVTAGYWGDPEKTAQAFVVPPGHNAVHYRTGDRVRRPAGSAPMTYLGRLDSQIKVRGVRIELGEVEAAVREATDVDAVIAVGWPRSLTGADGIVAFIGDTGVDVAEAKASLAATLPDHMVPRRFELLERLPLNASGKFDRKALVDSLEEAS